MALNSRKETAHSLLKHDVIRGNITITETTIH